MKNRFTNILLAEDDDYDYKFFLEALNKISVFSTVIRAKNGFDCIRYLKNNPTPDIIFLDLNIPLKNGLECLKFVRNVEDLTNLPVVIYSSSHYIKDIDTAYKNNANFYIVKPADADQLVNLLNTVLERLEEGSGKPAIRNFVVRLGSVVNH